MVEKTKIDIPVLLPDVEDARDGCIRRLRELLEAKEGVDSTHVLESAGAADQLCIHFDPRHWSLGEVRELAHRAGAELDRRFGHLLLQSHPMHASQARAKSDRLQQAAGVVEAVVSPDGMIRVEFDRQRVDEAGVRAAVRAAGLDLVDGLAWGLPAGRPGGALRPRFGRLGEHIDLLFALLAGACWLGAWLASLIMNVPSWALYLPAYFFGGLFPFRETVEKMAARRFEIDSLMLAAAAGAASLGEWAEGGLLLFLFSLGQSLEHYAMGRARRAIESLAEFTPATAFRRGPEGPEEIPVQELAPGDVVLVKPHARIPADGFVVAGQSSVDQSPITGESTPVDKRPAADPQQIARRPESVDPAHQVFAGTLNGSGALEVQVTRRAEETTLARLIQMVAEAETQKSPTQRFADRFERAFVPGVLAVVTLALFAWVVIDEPFRDSFYRAMAVLVAASPCALAIATPSAVLSAVARAGRGGVLVKGGGPLEHLGALTAIAFDKTGTLTHGRPRVTDLVPSQETSEEELLATAAAVEQLADHPLAAAVVHEAQRRLGQQQELPAASDLESLTGRGVRATLQGTSVYVGKAARDGQPALPEPIDHALRRLEENGRTTMVVRRGDRYLGAIGLMDTPRPAAASVVRQIRRLGVRRVVMLSGDHQRVAEAVARQIGLDEVRGDLLPEEKVAAVQQLRAEGDVAMVGDGVNDAPAMASATVGIAMGAAGSDVALETADVALMADNLATLPFAVGLSRKTSRVIRQNLWISLGMVALLVPATLLGLRIGPAVALHEGSTVLVVFNALRLLAYRGPRSEEGSAE